MSQNPERSNKKYLGWVKKQSCCNPNCKGNGGQVIIAAHQRILGNGGMGIKPPDKDALPLCFDCHTIEHRGAVTFWEQGGKFKTKLFVQDICDNHYRRYKLLS